VRRPTFRVQLAGCRAVSNTEQYEVRNREFQNCVVPRSGVGMHLSAREEVLWHKVTRNNPRDKISGRSVPVGLAGARTPTAPASTSPRLLSSLNYS
jgi:hypothetical protein